MSDKMKPFFYVFLGLCLTIFILIEGTLNSFEHGAFKQLVKYAFKHQDFNVCFEIAGYPNYNGKYCMYSVTDTKPIPTVKCEE